MPFTPAWAHVKWFSRFSFADPPRGLDEVVTPAFLALAVLSVVVVAALVPVDLWMERRSWYQRVNGWLAERADRSRLVMRVGTGMVLLLAWQADRVLVPDLPIPAPWVGWLEFGLAALLLFDGTAALAGAGVLLLYALGIREAGLYYMLDYLLVAGVGYYLIASGMRERRVAASALPALYATVGFSLCWVALEKMVWPDWGLYVLQENPQLALGLDLSFFLLAAAFIEFCLGYLLIINLLQRPMALVITLTFFATTLVFGKTEVIGHTLIHAALVVFILEGPGTVFRPPIALHRKPALRTAFAAVNLVLLLAILLPLYSTGAAEMHRAAVERGAVAAGGAASMKAIRVHEPGGPEVLRIEEIPTPAPRPGWVRIRVRAFGLNRSEMYTRQGHSPSVRFPRVLGIECVGEVDDAGGRELVAGQTVAALMGEMGRAYDGGYAEYTLVPRERVIPVRTSLPWDVLAALPETWLTAWGSLVDAMEVKAGQTLLIRGGTSSVGMAAAALAKSRGLRVIATTRDLAKAAALRANGADDVILDAGRVAEEVSRLVPEGVDALLELVGPVTLRDSLRAVRPRGIVCHTGLLGNVWVMESFEPLEDIPSTVRLTTYHSGTTTAARSTGALQEIADGVAAGRYRVSVERRFRFHEIVEAHRFMEENRGAGKLVVTLDS